MESSQDAPLMAHDVISYANDVLLKCNIEFEIEEIDECSSDLFLALYHAILGNFPAGTLVDCDSEEAQLHNIRCIIETLASDYLKVDLSHITPNDVMKGELMSIYNLLEILDGLLDYLLEKIELDSDSGDEGDVDSDQISDNARTMALETIQQEMSRNDVSLIAVSSSSTAELIQLGRSSDASDTTTDKFFPLKPEISLTPDVMSNADVDKEEDTLSDHTLQVSVKQWEEKDEIVDLSASTDVDSFKALPTHANELSDMMSTLTEMQVHSSREPDKLVSVSRSAPEPHPVRHSPPMSDSGTSMDSDARRHAFDVQLDGTHTSFLLKEKRQRIDEATSSASESIDVPDGGARLSQSDSNIGTPKYRSGRQEKDWQAMLDNLQKTVEESKKIREQYFSSSHGRSTKITDESDEYQASLVEDIHSADTAEETLNDSVQRRHPRHRKNVRFEDTISTKTAKQLIKFREVLQQERQLQNEKNRILSRNYKDHLDEVKEAEDGKLDPLRRRVRDSKKEIRQETKRGRMQKGRQKRNLTDAMKWKSWLSPRKLKQSPSRRARKAPSQIVAYPGIDTIGEHDLLPKLLEEFPQLELSPATLNDMWHKQFRQIEQLTSASVDHKNKKRRSEMMLQESHLKHELLTSIMQKEHEHTRHLRDIRERVAGQKEAQRTLRDRRLQTARIRRYYRDYHVQMRSKMLKRRTKEEKIFKRLFEDGLEIQKARLQELRKYARDKRNEQQKRQVDEIQSMENYYRDQFNILAETLAAEKSDLKIRDAAQAKLVRQMKKGLRQKMEKEITELQELIARDDEDTYFREIEADRLRRQLQLATYNAKFKV